MSMAQEWIAVSERDAIPEGDVIAVDINGHEIALYDVQGELYASDNMCTHAHARLCEGFLEGHAIECPLHQGKFDVRTGKALCTPATDDLRVYPVKIEGGKVFIAKN
jgi:naphthalene 1,2-dioxygenase system ferredoxin subunit